MVETVMVPRLFVIYFVILLIFIKLLPNFIQALLLHFCNYLYNIYHYFGYRSQIM